MIKITAETVIKTVSRKSIHGDRESLVFLQELQLEKVKEEVLLPCLFINKKELHQEFI